MIVLDKRIARSPYSYFTFANIRGRAGRMLKHFVGRVYVFHDPPPANLPIVDIPILRQAKSAPTSLLLAVDEGERTESTQERLESIASQGTCLRQH